MKWNHSSSKRKAQRILNKSERRSSPKLMPPHQ
jgi:hypothetical protein